MEEFCSCGHPDLSRSISLNLVIPVGEKISQLLTPSDLARRYPCSAIIYNRTFCTQCCLPVKL